MYFIYICKKTEELVDKKQAKLARARKKEQRNPKLVAAKST
jgi:hypothetical protein